MQILQRPLRRSRTAGLAPRMALYAALGVLSVAGGASIVRGHRTIHETFVSSGSSFDLAAAEFATEFARAYLSYQDANPTEQAQALSRFANDTIGNDAGVTPQGSQSVSWAEPAQEQPQPGGGEVITVACQTSTQPTPQYLAVPVIRTSGGTLAIANYPSFVGPPATAAQFQAETEQPVANAGLVQVVTRVITNYLALDAEDLSADLTPGAQVSLPTVALQLQHVTAVTWITPGRTVEVQVSATDQSGSTFSLAYTVGVTERERWYATSIAVNPSAP